jgi:putative transposase
MVSRSRNKKRSKAQPVQTELPFERLSSALPRKQRGGARPGAGRKPAPGRRLVRHRSRGAHRAAHPVHVVLRSCFRPLRSPFVFPTLRRALAKASRARPGFRVVQFSVQADHLHLIVEADTAQGLSRGMQGLAIRVARAVNRLVFRTGKVWADRFFSRSLSSPRAVKHALAYVLNNFRKHGGAGRARIDPYSSAPYFTGFRELHGRAPCELRAHAALPLVPRGVAPPSGSADIPVLPPFTWLANKGWQRSGSISLFAGPAE